jgi:hypothetical protein
LSLKISLRALMALFLAASLPMAWLSVYVRECNFARVLEARGHRVTWKSDTGMPFRWLPNDRIDKVTCAPHQTLDDDTLAALEGLSALECLDLTESLVTDDDLARAARAPSLVWCILAWTRVTDRGVAHLERLPKLTMLDLSGTAIGDPTLDWLARSQVSELNLNCCHLFTSAGLQELAKSRCLTSVELCSTPTHASDLPALCQNPSLYRISLMNAPLIMDDLRELEGWEQILPFILHRKIEVVTY